MSKNVLATGLIIGAILGLFPNSITTAQEIYINGKCQQNQQLEESDRFTVVYKSDFKTKGQTYWLYSGKYIDGSSIVCISRPGFKQPKLLNVKQIQSGYIDKIIKDSSNQTAFLVTVRNGNGSYVPITQYRVNLSTPSKPVTTKIRSWRSEG
ncbi:hypothetical protein Ava_4827 [Trichormus variabilis ATCC 29413]|uniref:Uncharacterized protein n=2 Tax=Anabaena variabilis TaxID=264691 RepID=Q3M3L2_TRIV2|nr:MULTISPECIES: hypothetical protein [Nostocaceae]ABA24424.1 hypothetical protein Ava_4827 [Trichormus variabilis ATCC 29413]MBC1214450.1 hypothetical protein [Trichormus variabilis ARAD]MBC1269144.1 hypothetical protein [Trichormus variabilis FSR]MBC1301552.1 hypothetical protein [Trichormus variabilis N2B]MBC1309981.1 hypothetical protein [Trichormus variabilis PNB]